MLPCILSAHASFFIFLLIKILTLAFAELHNFHSTWMITHKLQLVIKYILQFYSISSQLQIDISHLIEIYLQLYYQHRHHTTFDYVLFFFFSSLKVYSNLYEICILKVFANLSLYFWYQKDHFPSISHPLKMIGWIYSKGYSKTLHIAFYE